MNEGHRPNAIKQHVSVSWMDKIIKIENFRIISIYCMDTDEILGFSFFLKKSYLHSAQYYCEDVSVVIVTNRITR